MNRVKEFVRRHFSRQETFLDLLMLLTPITAFYLMQFAYCGNLPWDYSPSVLLANYLCIGVVHFTLCALTNYIVLCSVITHVLCFVWGIANYYVSLFRGTPILPWDFTALGTAAAGADSYRFSLNLQMVVCLLLLAGMIFLLRKQLLCGRFRPSKNRLRLRVRHRGLRLPGAASRRAGNLRHPDRCLGPVRLLLAGRGAGGLSAQHPVHVGGGAAGPLR